MLTALLRVDFLCGGGMTWILGGSHAQLSLRVGEQRTAPELPRLRRGRAGFGSEVRICRTDSDIGAEICVCGPGVMPGCGRQPQGTVRALWDGWFTPAAGGWKDEAGNVFD